MISYRNIDNEIITEKCILEECIKDDLFKLDSSWVRITDALPVSGNVTIGSNGNWFVDGEDTGFKAQGPKGDNGVPLQPRLSEDGTKIEYSLDGEEWKELFPLSLITPNISFEEPVGLEPGATPTVENVGDGFNVNLQFGLPKAPEVNVGSTTTIGEGNQAKVTNSGTPYAPVLNFQIPKGDTGRGITIKGFYPDLSTLQEKITSPAIGDVYCVGSAEPYTGYVWTNVYSLESQTAAPAWQSIGTISKDTTILVNDLGDREDVGMTQKGVTEEYEFIKNTRTVFNVNNYVDSSDTSTTYTLQDAINIIPEKERSLVKVILYRSSEGARIAIFNSNSYKTGFTNINNWIVINDESYYSNRTKGFRFSSSPLEMDRNAGECIREVKFIPPSGKETHDFYLKVIPKNGTLNDFYVYNKTESSQCSFICKNGSSSKPYTGVYVDILDNDGRTGWEGSKLYINVDFDKLDQTQYNVTNYVLLLEKYTELDLYFKCVDSINSINRKLEVAAKVEGEILEGYFSNGATNIANAEWNVLQVTIDDVNRQYWASGSVRPSTTKLADYLTRDGIYISSEYRGDGIITYYTKQKLNVPKNTGIIKITSYYTDTPELYAGAESSLNDVKNELEDKINDKRESSEINYWFNKVIWWCGTSIPAGSDATLGSEDTIAGNYPTEVGKNLGATVVNKAVGGSMCRANVRTGDYNGANFSNITSALSMTKAEVEYFITNYDSIKSKLTGNPPDSLDQSYLNRLRSASYEDRLLPYLDGTYDMPDLFVIDHGHNDWKYNFNGQSDITLEPTRDNISKGYLTEDTYMTSNNNEKLESVFGSLGNINPSDLDKFICSINRNCYIGSVNFIITLILVHNPKARIVLISNYEYKNGNNPNFAPLIIAQESIANSWAFPLCEVYKYLGFSSHVIPGTKDYWTKEGYSYDYDINAFTIYNPDKVHPHSDISGDANNIYAGVISEFLKKCR